ncbi:MAG TPA: UDP-galactopyranose mutase [Candidatus Sulfotelmatobacter sp.]|nr:UDP-galactopyranose mutase [Candidatus Sulfotelmatobacter sp.]
MKSYDLLIVGAGWAGAVAAEQLAAAGRSVLLVEKRPQLGGNCFDRPDENGVYVHEYGPHIFHTNDRAVWEYLAAFTEWLPYQHRVLADHDGQRLTLPVNLNTLRELFPGSKADSLEQRLVERFGPGKRLPVQELRRSEDIDFRALGEEIYQKIYYQYSLKQWGMEPAKLDRLVLGRVPIRLDRDDRYFQDVYQGMPKNGYTAIFRKLLDRPNIEVVLGQDFRRVAGKVKYGTMIYTGPLDEYFDLKFGPLPYRSLRFDFSVEKTAQFQPAAVVNYTGREPFTRITEFKHFQPAAVRTTTILREYPAVYRPGQNVPCYPVPLEENHRLFARYKAAAAEVDNVIFLGRLAEYCYYDMDKVIAKALTAAAGLAGRK